MPQNKQDKDKFTYAKSGVDIIEEEKAIRSLTDKLSFVRRGVLGKPILVGHYASVVDMGEFGIAITTDGVGSKILICEAINKYDTIGIDCVAMNVNDLIAVGAEPVAMVDYIALESPNEKIMEEIAVGLEKGCKMANITLVGGETASLPDMIKGFDLAGTAIGYVRKDKIITGNEIKPGDIIFGIPSDGLHSNGLTLVRKVIENSGVKYTDSFGDKTLGEEILTPTRIYIEVLDVLKRCEVHGLAHITGGGFLNLKRLKRLKFVIENPLPAQKIFGFIQELGNIDYDEMQRTFNMGTGFAVVLPESEVEKIGIEGGVIGHIEEGSGVFVEGVEIK